MVDTFPCPCASLRWLLMRFRVISGELDHFEARLQFGVECQVAALLIVSQ
jgi:hypothetical protein